MQIRSEINFYNEVVFLFEVALIKTNNRAVLQRAIARERIKMSFIHVNLACERTIPYVCNSCNLEEARFDNHAAKPTEVEEKKENKSINDKLLLVHCSLHYTGLCKLL